MQSREWEVNGWFIQATWLTDEKDDNMDKIL